MLFRSRLRGGDIDPFVISMWGSMVASFALLPLLPFVWVTLTPHQLGIAGLKACVTALSQTMMVAAMSSEPYGSFCIYRDNICRNYRVFNIWIIARHHGSLRNDLNYR